MASCSTGSRIAESTPAHLAAIARDTQTSCKAIRPPLAPPPVMGRFSCKDCSRATSPTGSSLTSHGAAAPSRAARTSRAGDAATRPTPLPEIPGNVPRSIQPHAGLKHHIAVDPYPDRLVAAKIQTVGGIEDQVPFKTEFIGIGRIDENPRNAFYGVVWNIRSAGVRLDRVC